MFDGLLLMVGAVILTGVGAAVGLFADDAWMTAMVACLVLLNAGGVLYLAAMESSRRGATIGKRMLGLAVTTSAGERVSFARALGRAAAKYLSTVTLLVGWLLAAWTPRKRALHDFVAGTVVVRQAEPPASVWVIVGLLLLAGSVPAAGVVAAVAIPGILRARMVGNETAAIGALRMIRQAQLDYHRRCGGYAISLTTLAGPPRHLHADLTVANSVTYSGYTIMMASAPGSVIRDTPQGCLNTVSGYEAQAAPAMPGRTGVRYLVMGSDGVIFAGNDANLSPRWPVE